MDSDVNMLPTYDSFALPISSVSQLKAAEAKVVNPIVEQGRKGVVDEKASAFKLIDLQKSLPAYTPPSESPNSGLPVYSYGHAGIPTHHRKSAAYSARVSKKIAEKKLDFKPCKISPDVPAFMVHIRRKPCKESPCTFSATIKCREILKLYQNGETKAPFLSQPIAFEDWRGLYCNTYKLNGNMEDAFELFGKVTWEEFFKELHSGWPTQSCEDVPLEENDAPEYYWEYFKVEIVLLSGEEIR